MEKIWSVWVVVHMVKSCLEWRAVLGIFQPWPIFMQQYLKNHSFDGHYFVLTTRLPNEVSSVINMKMIT